MSRESVVVGVGLICLFLVLLALKILYRQWWLPNRIQRLMAQRGIKGPPYSFIHGNTKHIISMQNQSMINPLTFSHHTIFPTLQPHIPYWTNLYGKNFLQWDGSQAELVVTDMNLVKEVLTDSHGVFSKEIIMKPFLKRLLGNGLVTSQGQKWFKVRKLANYAFHAESLKSMIPAMIESTETMLAKWKNHESEEIDVYEEFRLLTSEVISRTAFGSSYLEGKSIFEMMSKLTLLASRNYYQLTLPFISKVLKSFDEIESERLEKAVHDCIVKLIRKREEKVMSGEELNYGTDFLGLLINAKHEEDESQRISVEDVVDECKTFYFAGQETTNSLLAWTVFLLSIHFDWQEEARKEVLDLFGKEQPKPDGLTKLKIMSMIINESLRLYPPVIRISREVEKETKLGTFDIPANLRLFISNLAAHHDTEVWGDDAHLFKPERFAEGIAKATKNNISAFFPFGLGPRNCVGFNFAIAEVKVALAMILQRYSFALSPAYVHSPTQVLTVRPRHGIQVLIQPL